MQQGNHARIQFDVFSLSAPIPYDIAAPMWNLSVAPTETPHNWIPSHGIEFPMTSKLIGLESEEKGKDNGQIYKTSQPRSPYITLPTA